MPQTKAKSVAKAKTHAQSAKADTFKSQKSAGKARVSDSASDAINTNQFVNQATSTQVKEVGITNATPENKADLTKKPNQRKKELEEHRSKHLAYKSKKEHSGKPITASKKKENDSKTPSTSKYVSKPTPVLSVGAAKANVHEDGAKSLDVSSTQFCSQSVQ